MERILTSYFDRKERVTRILNDDDRNDWWIGRRENGENL